MQRINLEEKFRQFDSVWDPKIVAELNGQYVKLAKIKGTFDWHHHENEDELFLVIHGGFRMELRDKSIDLTEGEMIIIPKGVEHRPVADEEAHILLFEPVSTLNTGNVRSERTRDTLEQI